MVCLAVFVAGLWLQVASTSTFEKCYTVGDNKHCFKTELASRKTWANAKKYCETKVDGSYNLLVNDRHIHNALVQFMVLGDFVEGHVSHVWTGITQTTQGQWFWIDDTPYTGKISALHRFTRAELTVKVTQGHP